MGFNWKKQIVLLKFPVLMLKMRSYTKETKYVDCFPRYKKLTKEDDNLSNIKWDKTNGMKAEVFNFSLQCFTGKIKMNSSVSQSMFSKKNNHIKK